MKGKTLLEHTLDITALILLLVAFIYVFLEWSALPNSIPLKYDSSGIVAQSGNKMSVLGLPTIGVLAWGVFTIVEKFPHNINLPLFQFDDKEKELMYNRVLINIIKNAIVYGLVIANWQFIESMLTEA